MKWNRQKGLSLKDKFALHRQAYHDIWFRSREGGPNCHRRDDGNTLVLLRRWRRGRRR